MEISYLNVTLAQQRLVSRMSPSNEAAWLPSKATIFEIRRAPYTPPRAHEIVIKNLAVAVNPADWYQQTFEPFPLQYPTILGHDTAGVVEEVGESVTRFKVGERVLGHGCGMSTKRDCDCTFQKYTVVADNMASHIPTSLSFEAAAVIPLGYSTAACGMYQKDFLALQYPSVRPKSTGQALLVWAGSTSVGSNAIQLGVASGYEVFTTASPKNFEYVKRLGAAQVFDYSSKTVVDDLVAALEGKVTAGAIDCISTNDSTDLCGEILSRSECSTRMIATVLGPAEGELPTGVKTKNIWALSLMENEVGKVVYEDYLPDALEVGAFVSAPEYQVVGSGLNSIQLGLDTLKKGVSAKKIIVTL